MSSRHHHAEWLSLVEVSGPFLTLPVLERVLPQGLDKDDSPEAKAHARNLRLAFDEWEDNQTGIRPNPAIHRAWIDFVLKQTLGFSKEAHAEFDESAYGEGQAVPQTVAHKGLRPDALVRNPLGVPNAGKARLLVQAYPVEQDLERSVVGRPLSSSPSTRMVELLRATDVQLGLVTNGEHWMLVNSPRDGTTGFASWYATLWFDEPLTLRAFRSLLGVRRFFSVAHDETLEAMLKESAEHQEEVTDQLGLQVRRAVEVLIQSLDRADQDHGRELLGDVPEAVLYEAALTVMMRLVFLFYAEENKLIPAQTDDELYLQNYAVSTVLDQLQGAADQHGEEVLERRLDAWARLLSTFRAVFAGVQHERMKLPAYGGGLFYPDRYPFLEGRPKRVDKQGRQINDWRKEPAAPLPVNNRTVLHLLRALQYLQGERKDDPAVRLSFKGLGIEQIGHVYETLLDHTAKRAAEPVVGLLCAKGIKTEVALAELERLAAKGEADLIAFLNDQTGRQEKTLRRGLAAPLEGEEAKRLRAVCGNDEMLFQCVLPFSGLLRNDTFDRPAVVRKGSVFVTAGTDRRSSGTHYTPPSLTEPIVRYTLEPLVFDGPAEGKPEAEWKLLSAKELLDLKICDMACGSGAFLVQACRYLSELLVKAWKEGEGKFPEGTRITPYGEPSQAVVSEQPIPTDMNERLVYARRIVAQRCLYGVDRNHLAAEMAKLSLWLLTLAKDKPFTFLNHAIRRGDSLVGIRDLQQLENLTMSGEKQYAPVFLESLQSSVRQAIQLRQRLESGPANNIQAAQDQERLFGQASLLTAKLRAAADLLIADALGGDDRGVVTVVARFVASTPDSLQAEASKQLDGQPTFHWPLEFPEVFDRGGFDAFVCNPPFMGGQKITGNLGEEYREYLVSHLANGRRGSADLCAYFFLRAGLLLRDNGQLGFLATNTIAQGDTREVGLEQLTADGCVIPRAVPSRPWPGAANLEVAHVWLRRGSWNGPFVLDDRPATGITAFLSASVSITGKPQRLATNAKLAFKGVDITGLGFLVELGEMTNLIAANINNREVLFPFLNGEELSTRPDMSASRWAINFFDWPLKRQDLSSRSKGPVASNYPECLSVVAERVKPEREQSRQAVLRSKWWQYARTRPALQKALAGRETVVLKAEAADMFAFAIVPTRQTFSNTLCIFVAPVETLFPVLQSTLHEAWVRQYGATLKADRRYSVSDCFETFPLPSDSPNLAAVGNSYHDHRRQIMLARQEGLTMIYNRLHDREEESTDIQKLRELHVEMDRAVAAAYGWADLDLGHGFHETKQGVRFTIGELARREVLARLLTLNHERYAAEVKQGRHEKKKPRRKGAEGGELFG